MISGGKLQGSQLFFQRCILRGPTRKQHQRQKKGFPLEFSLTSDGNSWHWLWSSRFSLINWLKNEFIQTKSNQRLENCGRENKRIGLAESFLLSLEILIECVCRLHTQARKLVDHDYFTFPCANWGCKWKKVPNFESSAPQRQIFRHFEMGQQLRKLHWSDLVTFQGKK